MTGSGSTLHSNSFLNVHYQDMRSYGEGCEVNNSKIRTVLTDYNIGDPACPVIGLYYQFNSYYLSGNINLPCR